MTLRLFDLAFVGSLQGAEQLPLLLDDYPGAAAAYSLQQLASGVLIVVRVRRSSDNTEQDFTPLEVFNGTLAAWVGAGNNGFVVTWYDHSGNNRHAVQTNAANQPQIVENGAVILENGKPAVRFSSGQFLDVNHSIAFNYMFHVGKTNTGATDLVAFLLGNRASVLPIFAYGPLSSAFANETYTITVDGNNYMYITNLLKGSQALTTIDLGGRLVFLNGQSATTAGLGTVTLTMAFNIGARNTAALNTYNGFLQEMIIYSSSQSASRAGIEENINQRYEVWT